MSDEMPKPGDKKIHPTGGQIRCMVVADGYVMARLVLSVNEWNDLEPDLTGVPFSPLNKERIAAARERFARGEGRKLDDIIRELE